MKKMNAIRAALRGGKRLTLSQLQPQVENRIKQIFGRQKLYTLLSVAKTAGEIESAGRGEARTYWLAST